MTIYYRALKLSVLICGASVCLYGLLPGQAAGRAEQQPAAAQAERLFVEKIEPALAAKCQICHGEDGAAGLDARSRASLLKGGKRGAAIIPGDAEKSLLYLALLGRDGLKQMPPGKPLADDLTAAFKQWIDAGAPWVELRKEAAATVAETKWTYAEDDVWAFKPVKRDDMPTTCDAQSIQTPVDAFVLQKLNEKAIKPAPAADRATLIRRATFDLHGLPPTPEEVVAFARDPAPTAKAFEKVVERLLGSPRYGERWGRHWLDVVRYADTAGGSNDYERPNAWRYRDYVIRSFNEDRPYDRFIIEQIAGDELDPNNPENLIATGFLRMGPWEHTSMSVEAVTRQEWLDDVTHSTVTAFLGLTMGCAKCHDHKFDPIPTKDYYSVQAVFATTYFEERPAPFLPSENISRAEAHRAQWQPRLERAERKYDEAALALGKKPRRRGAAQTTNNAPPPQQQQTELKRADPKQIENLELERAYVKRVEFLNLALKRFAPLAFSVSSSGLKEKTPPEETFILASGNLSARGEQVFPAVLRAPTAVPLKLNLKKARTEPPELPRTIEKRRLGWARWIADRDNPLTARVMVNRVWQYHFGKGIVETSNNFGKLGKRPTHPELLDWLAAYFVENGWSVKKLHRLLMNSAVYQRASQYPEAEKSAAELAAQVDPESNLLARFTPRRIEAEALRDGMLAVSGELNFEMGGPGGFPEINDDLVAQPRLIMGTVAPAYEASLAKAERNRRTIYTFQQRSLVNPLIEVFNGANLNESCEFRRTSTVAPQVFSLFNSRFSADLSLAFAKRLETMTKDRARQIELAFQLAFQRRPTLREKQRALAHIAAMTAHHRVHRPAPLAPRTPAITAVNSEYNGETFRFTEDQDWNRHEYNLHPSQVSAETRALAELCLALLNANEFVYVY
jgi:mono/diheme cytochrome c family protein